MIDITDAAEEAITRMCYRLEMRWREDERKRAMQQTNRPLTKDNEPAPDPPPTRPVLATSVWDESRCDELEALEELLLNAALIDSTSNCLTRIANVIALANKLIDTDWKNGRSGFCMFLRDRCFADRYGAIVVDHVVETA